jgi:hypothetical protein
MSLAWKKDGSGGRITKPVKERYERKYAERTKKQQAEAKLNRQVELYLTTMPGAKRAPAVLASPLPLISVWCVCGSTLC